MGQNTKQLNQSRSYKKINRGVGKALHQYHMISDGDKIAVGLSGGADSLTLLWMLNERLSRIPIHYELHAIYIDPGFNPDLGRGIEQYCIKKGYNIRVDYTDHGIVAHSKQNRENPCFLCSRLRRKRLFEIADELGCTKLALGHNKDDIIETLFMNMFYSGGISTMNPSQFLFKGRFQIIRPLSFVDEHIIRRFVGEKVFPKFFNPCPSASTSKRYEIKMLLDRLYQKNENIKGNIFRAMGNIKKEYLLV